MNARTYDFLPSIPTLFSAVFFLAVGFAPAQSLEPENPYPLKAGINKGTADSLVGTQYWRRNDY